jgi:hypothetical protein
MQTGNIQFSIGPGAPTISPAGSLAYACRLELDINTDAAFPNVLPKERLASIFRELVELAKEITARGDNP